MCFSLVLKQTMPKPPKGGFWKLSTSVFPGVKRLCQNSEILENGPLKSFAVIEKSLTGQISPKIFSGSFFIRVLTQPLHARVGEVAGILSPIYGAFPRSVREERGQGSYAKASPRARRKNRVAVECLN